ncbi:hypothetical protein ACU7RR_004214 [Providencia stuartii]|uniref:Uncharacterized protein n=2 Tax=Providencia TaxID=586 RepID=A0A1V0M787_PRORE|nr:MULTISPECIES: hypothetical protein [Enterobacterales]USB38698.1 hypothetical protein M5J11_09570 [Providencia vermicola]HEI9770055.1 hypothetical protein [Morganella morganii]ARD70759.1 hypothetical protein pC131_00029 [Providencia rettgeri]EKH6498034.1 hypothetical protein [Providencia rettgeri]EKV7295340.1 hypothetical protein [Proteus mirabilis]
MFVFKEDTFQRNPSNPCPDNEFNSDVIDFIKEIRKFYPELEHWSNTGVLFAWEGYLQDVYAVGWTELVRKRENGFLAYCYISQLRPCFDFGGTGTYNTEVWDLGEQEPWKKQLLPKLPDWLE